MLSMDAQTREDKAVKIMTEMLEKLQNYVNQDATHDGLQNCDLLADARQWLNRRKDQISMTETKAKTEY